MLDTEFPDEKIIRYIAAQKRLTQEREEKGTQNDISQGYAYINEDRITFTRYALLGKDLSTIVPVKFLPKGNLSDSSDTTIILTNHDKSVCLSFESLRKPTNMPVEDFVRSELAKMRTSLTNIENDSIIETEQAKISYIESSSPKVSEEESKDADNYQLSFLYVPKGSGKAENVLIKGIFTCADFRVNNWKEILFQIMRSIS